MMMMLLTCVVLVGMEISSAAAYPRPSAAYTCNHSYATTCSLAQLNSGACVSATGSCSMATCNENSLWSLKCISAQSCTGADTVFQSYDGHCNNLGFPAFGATNQTLLRRKLSAHYADASGTMMSSTHSAREISNFIFSQPAQIVESDVKTTQLFMAVGHAMAQEMGLSSGGSSLSAPIPVPKCDAFLDPGCTGSVTLPFNRSSSAVVNGILTPINANTAFIDGGIIYGTSENSVSCLRSYVGGKLLVDSITGGLPKCSTLMQQGSKCPFATQQRATGAVDLNSNPLLQALITVFAREHNRKATLLAADHSHWADEELFQAARRFVIALQQKIFVYDYGQMVIGKSLPPYLGYDPTIDPGLETFVSTVAFRFGHSQVPKTFNRVKTNGDLIDSILYRNAWHKPELVEGQLTKDPADLTLEAVLRGAMRGLAGPIGGSFSNDTRNFLDSESFLPKHDLASINIQRGRDHGMPSYNDARRGYQLEAMPNFDAMTSNPTVKGSLQYLYTSPDDIQDPYVGGMLEQPDPGAVVGPLFAAAITDQLTRIRDGDRFWFENDLVISPDDLIAVKATQLIDVITRNTKISPSEGLSALKSIEPTTGITDLVCQTLTTLGNGTSIAWRAVESESMLELTFTMDAGGWVGFAMAGSNPEGVMPGADFIIVQHLGTKVLADDRSAFTFDTPFADTAVDGCTNNVELISVTTGSDTSKIMVTVRRPYAASDKLDLPVPKDIARIAYAWGQGAYSYHFANRRKSTAYLRACGVETVITDTSYTSTQENRMLHSVLMGSIWGVNLFVGVFVARYERHTAWWKGAHRLLQLMSTVVMYPAYFIAMRMVKQNAASPHAILGIFLVLGTTLQTLMGVISYAVHKFMSDKEKRSHVEASDFAFRASMRLGKVTKADLAKRRAVRSGCAEYTTVFHVVFGKLLLLAAVVEILLGLFKIGASDILIKVYILWGACIVSIFLYKELELCGVWPRGYMGKVGCLVSVFCPCCLRKKHSGGSVMEDVAAESKALSCDVDIPLKADDLLRRSDTSLTANSFALWREDHARASDDEFSSNRKLSIDLEAEISAEQAVLFGGGLVSVDHAEDVGSLGVHDGGAHAVESSSVTELEITTGTSGLVEGLIAEGAGASAGAATSASNLVEDDIAARREEERETAIAASGTSSFVEGIIADEGAGVSAAGTMSSILVEDDVADRAREGSGVKTGSVVAA